MVQLNLHRRRDNSAGAVPDPLAGSTRAIPLIGAIVLSGVGSIIIARWLTATGYRPVPFGLPDPGPVTAIGLPMAQFVHELAGIAVVGVLFLRCIGLRSADRAADRHLAELTTRWAWIWTVSTLVWIVFTMSDLIGVPVLRLLSHLDLIVIVAGTNRVLGESVTLWVALALAMFGARVQKTWAVATVLLIASAALLPTALTGHASHHSSPTVASVSLAVHVVAASLWVGGLLALILHLRPFPVALKAAVPRFSVAALVCIIAVGVSGVVESAVTLDSWAALFGSNRGHLMLAKAFALVVLAGIGLLHRRRTMVSASSGRLLPLLHLAAVELVLMGATVGIAVVLSVTA